LRDGFRQAKTYLSKKGFYFLHSAMFAFHQARLFSPFLQGEMYNLSAILAFLLQTTVAKHIT